MKLKHETRETSAFPTHSNGPTIGSESIRAFINWNGLLRQGCSLTATSNRRRLNADIFQNFSVMPGETTRQWGKTMMECDDSADFFNDSGSSIPPEG
jgi:hypothetical protein